MDCKVDSMSLETQWTPAHWAARHGDTTTMHLICEKDGKIYLPDKQGVFPIDIAGFFGHMTTLKVLIEHSIAKFKEF